VFFIDTLVSGTFQFTSFPSSEYNAFKSTIDATMGTNQITGVVSTTGVDFTNYGNKDFTPVTGGKIDNEGLNLFSTFTTDIANLVRPSSGAWSVGAFRATPSSGATYTGSGTAALTGTLLASGTGLYAIPPTYTGTGTAAFTATLLASGTGIYGTVVYVGTGTAALTGTLLATGTGGYVPLAGPTYSGTGTAAFTGTLLASGTGTYDAAVTLGGIYVGTNEITPGELWIGGSEVQQVWVGTTNVWLNKPLNKYVVTSTELGSPFDTGTTKTINNVPIGFADAQRRVIICFQTQGAGGHTVVLGGITIGGVVATSITTALGNTTCTIAYATVTSGTTATVVVELSAGAGNSAIGGLIAGAFIPASGSLSANTWTTNNLTTGVATVTALASKLTLYATATQLLSPAASMNMTLVNGIETFYNPVDINGIWVAGIQPANSGAGGSRTFTPNWTPPPGPTASSLTGTVAIAFT
jgi:hypothetical protein